MTYLAAEIAGMLVFASALAGIIGWVGRDFAVRWELTEGDPGTDLERKLQEQMELNMQLRDDLDTARMRLRDLDGQLTAREPERQALEAELSRRANTIKALEKGIENGRAQLALSNDALSRLRSDLQESTSELESSRMRIAMLEEAARQAPSVPPPSPVETGPVAVDPEPVYASAPEPPFARRVLTHQPEDELIEALEAPELSEEVPFPPPAQVSVSSVRIRTEEHAEPPGVPVPLPERGVASVQVTTPPARSRVGDLIASFGDGDDPADMITADVVIELGDEEPEPEALDVPVTVELEAVPATEEPADEVVHESALLDSATLDSEITPPRQAQVTAPPALVRVEDAGAEVARTPDRVPEAGPAAEASALFDSPTPRAGDLTTEQAKQRMRGFVAALADVVDGADDDLQQIKGIGPKTSGTLAKLGLTTYRHLAVLPDAEVEVMAKAIRYSPAKIRRSDWSGQARRLHQLKTGEQLA